MNYFISGLTSACKIARHGPIQRAIASEGESDCHGVWYVMETQRWGAIFGSLCSIIYIPSCLGNPGLSPNNPPLTARAGVSKTGNAMDPRRFGFIDPPPAQTLESAIRALCQVSAHLPPTSPGQAVLRRALSTLAGQLYAWPDFLHAMLWRVGQSLRVIDPHFTSACQCV